MSNVKNKASQKKIITAGIVGNIMEWYDFAIYGYFAIIIGKIFFPSESAAAATVAAFGAFAAGFLMRPIGSLFFGHIGDKFGRKKVLIISVLLMAVPTFLIGFLPTYNQIGVLAPIMLVVLRMLQGLSVGGEYTASMIFLAEQSPNHKRGLTTSWSNCGSLIGVLLGSIVAAAMSTLLTDAQLHSWGWRLPFMVGIMIALFALFIRKDLKDDAPKPTKKVEASPIVSAFKDEWRTMFRIFGLNIVNAVGFYVIFVYIATWLQEATHISAAKSLDINTASMFAMLFFIPLAGMLSDKIGRKTVLLISASGFVIFTYPLFWLMHHPSIVLIVLGQMGFAILISLYAGTNPAAMAEMVPSKNRVTTVSVSYNLVQALLGGTAPIICAYLTVRSHNDFSPAFYLIVAAVISFFTALTLKETAHKPLIK